MNGRVFKSLSSDNFVFKLQDKKMKIIPPNLYKIEDIKNLIWYIKLFTPDSNWTWDITEFYKKDLDTCFGFVIGHESELGYFSLKELQKLIILL